MKLITNNSFKCNNKITLLKLAIISAVQIKMKSSTYLKIINISYKKRLLSFRRTVMSYAVLCAICLGRDTYKSAYRKCTVRHIRRTFK